MTFSIISTLITIIPQTILTWLLNKQGKIYLILGVLLYIISTLLAVYIILTYTVDMEED